MHCQIVASLDSAFEQIPRQRHALHRSQQLQSELPLAAQASGEKHKPETCSLLNEEKQPNSAEPREGSRVAARSNSRQIGEAIPSSSQILGQLGRKLQNAF